MSIANTSTSGGAGATLVDISQTTPGTTNGVVVNTLGAPSGYVPLAIDNTAVNNNILYIGYAPLGTAQSAASWAIREFAYDGNGNISQPNLWANIVAGVPATNLVWNSRAGYTYS